MVSVIVPAFNAEATVGATLASISRQTYPSLEILVVDDGSTDATGRIVAEFCRQDGRGRLLAKANGGVASARNLGLAEAQGRFVAPIDADDVWHCRKIERQVELALSVPDLGFVYALNRRIDASGRVLADQQPVVDDPGPMFHRMLYRNIVGNGSALLMPRQLVIQVGGYDERLRLLGAEGCEDYLLQLKLARHHAVAVVPQYLVGYRLTPGAMSSDPERMFRSWQEAIRLSVVEGGDGPSPLIDWAFSVRALGLALDRAKRGRWRAAGSLLRHAIARDPLAVAHLAYVTAQAVTRRARRRGRLAPDRAVFELCDPASASPLAGGRLSTTWLLADHLKRTRMAYAADLDRGPSAKRTAGDPWTWPGAFSGAERACQRN